MSNASSIRVVSSGAEVFQWTCQARAAGLRVGVVPTMGALHEGHLSLVHAARQECQRVIVTIFVNPTQFGPNEDFQKYPRTLERDLAMLADAGVDCVFVPDMREIYPAGFSTYVDPPAVSLPLEGQFRPGHFRGVATIVLKLFLLIPADFAYFGRKDYQQTLVVRRMVDDLSVPITVRVCSTMREPDGLALSSRNRYLQPAERQRALAISRGMFAARELFVAGERRGAVLRQRVVDELQLSEITDIDYVAVADPDTLLEPDVLNGPGVVLVAARVGSTRLIDNLALE